MPVIDQYHYEFLEQAATTRGCIMCNAPTVYRLKPKPYHPSSSKRYSLCLSCCLGVGLDQRSRAIHVADAARKA